MHKHKHQFKEHQATDKHPFHFVWSGLPNVYLSGIEYGLCECGMRQGFYPKPFQLADALTKLITQKKSRLTPLEIKYLRKSLKQDHKKFARQIGVCVTQVSRWENGRSSPSNSTEKLIRLFAGANKENLGRIFDDASEKEFYLLEFEKKKWSAMGRGLNLL